MYITPGRVTILSCVFKWSLLLVCRPGSEPTVHRGCHQICSEGASPAHGGWGASSPLTSSHALCSCLMCLPIHFACYRCTRIMCMLTGASSTPLRRSCLRWGQSTPALWSWRLSTLPLNVTWESEWRARKPPPYVSAVVVCFIHTLKSHFH